MAAPTSWLIRIALSPKRWARLETGGAATWFTGDASTSFTLSAVSSILFMHRIKMTSAAAVFLCIIQCRVRILE